MLKRITGEDRLKIALEVFGSDDGIRPRFPRRGEAIQGYSEKIADAQLASCEAQLQEILAEERKKIGEWLLTLIKPTLAEPDIDYAKVYPEDIGALKRGELPEGVK